MCAVSDAGVDAAVEWPEGTRPEDAHTLSAKASIQIVRRVASLALAPGSSFTERELAEDLGLGKAPVREALQSLTRTGIVSARSGSGYRVAPITLRASRDVFEAWRIIEVEAASLAASRGAGAETLALWVRIPLEANASTEARTETDDVVMDEIFREVNFHLLTVSFSLNHRLALIFWDLAPHIERLLRFAKRLGATFDTAQADHDVLVEAFRAADPDAARRLTAEHLARLEKAVFDALLTSSAAQEVNLAEE